MIHEAKQAECDPSLAPDQSGNGECLMHWSVYKDSEFISSVSAGLISVVSKGLKWLRSQPVNRRSLFGVQTLSLILSAPTLVAEAW